MDLSKLPREEFEERLEKRSSADLKAMAQAYGIAVPAGLNAKAALLDLIYDGLQAKSSASASESGGAPPVAAQGASPSPLPDSEPRRIVLCATRHASHFKFGFKFTNEWQEVRESQFTAEQWLFLEKYPHVRVKKLTVSAG